MGKVRPFMNAENDQLFKNLRDIYREGIPSKDFSLDQINGSKNFTLYFQKLEEENLLVKQKNYPLNILGRIIMEKNNSNAVIRIASILIFLVYGRSLVFTLKLIFYLVLAKFSIR